MRLLALLYILLPFHIGPIGSSSDLSYITNETCAPVPVIDRAVLRHMDKYGLVGAQLAYMRNDSLLYVKGYGYADMENGIAMEPNMSMRIASVSKLVTATAIMKLREKGLLELDSRVLGEGGILADEDCASVLRDPRMKNITVEHLLRHQAGFTAKRSDPMFTTGITSGEMAVQKALGSRLAFSPGTSQEYSNVGYYLLSLVIEKLTGEDYGEWVKKNILFPMNCNSFFLAGTYREDRQPNEVCYHMHKEASLKADYHASGELVQGCYGANNIAGLKGAGGWAASAADLCRFVAGINYDAGIRGILDKESVDLMTEYFDKDTFSLGWNDTNLDGVWTRTGSFGGTTAIIKHYSKSGDCWVLLTNSSTYLGPRIATRTSRMIEGLREKELKGLSGTDLFYQNFLLYLKNN